MRRALGTLLRESKGVVIERENDHCVISNNREDPYSY